MLPYLSSPSGTVLYCFRLSCTTSDPFWASPKNVSIYAYASIGDGMVVGSVGDMQKRGTDVSLGAGETGNR